MLYRYKCTREDCNSFRDTDLITVQGPCAKCGAPMVLEETFGFTESAETYELKPKRKKRRRKKKK
jgi:hypothetical protein